jgi:transposase-like protein
MVLMTLADLLRETLDIDCDEVWENERTPTPVRVFGVRLHSMGLSLREIVAVLDWLGVDRSHGAVWNWTHRLAEEQADPPTVEPPRVAVDETQIEVDGEEKWVYAAIDTDSKLLLEIDVVSRRGTDPAAAFLHRLTEKHEVDNTEFLVDGAGYLTALARHDLSGHLNYHSRNYIEKWFQTVSMRIDRFHSFWRGSPASARRWLRRFRHPYNHDRPNQALDGRTPAEEVLN